MKRVMMFLLVCALMIGLVACQGTPTTTTGATTTAATTTTAAGETTTTAAGETTTTAAETTTAGPVEIIDMKYVIPGDLMPDESMVMEQINAKLEADGVGIKLVREGIPWDVWADKVNLKFTSGEEFDMFHIMQDWIPYNNYFSRGALVDVTDLIDEYGPVVKEKIPEAMWEGSKIKGRNYIIPTFWIDLAIDTPIFYRDDIFRQYGLSVPKTAEDILDCYRTVRADWKGVNKPILNFSIPTYDAAVLQISPKLHRLYDAYPFIVKDQFFQIFQDGTVKSWFESEEFIQDCAFMNAAYKDGIIQPDILSVNFDWYNNYMSTGDAFLWTVPSLDQAKKQNPDVKVEDMKSFVFAPEKPAIRNWGIKNCNGVSVTSKHPENAVKFTNWLWSSQENYDLYMYGIEGTHWNRDPNNERGIAPIRDATTNQNNYQTGDDWKIGFIEMVRYDTTGFMAYNEIAYVEDPNAQNSIAGAFFFDASGIATEYANVQAEAAAVMTPIVMGVQPYDEFFDAALSRLKAAGLDTMVTEYQKQLSEFIANQK